MIRPVLKPALGILRRSDRVTTGLQYAYLLNEAGGATLTEIVTGDRRADATLAAGPSNVTYRSNATAGWNTATSAGLTLTVNKPAGTVDNDVMVAAFTTDKFTSPATVSAPAGWTSRLSTVGGGNNQKLQIFSKLAASEGASYDFTVDAAIDGCAAITSYSGCDTTTHIDVAAAATATSTSTTLVAPSVTTVTNNAMLIGVYGISGSQSTFTPAGSMTERLDFNQAGNNYNTALEMNDEVQASAGASGTRTSTYAGTCSSGVSALLALRPVAGSLPNRTTNTTPLGTVVNFATSGYATIPTTNNLGGSTAVTFEAYLMLRTVSSSAATPRYIYCDNNTTRRRFSVYVWDSNAAEGAAASCLGFNWDNGSALNDIAPTVTFPLNSPVHIVVSVDRATNGKGAFIMQNGKVVFTDTAALAALAATTTQSVNIGALNGTFPFDGHVSYIRIWKNRAISQQEALNLYDDPFGMFSLRPREFVYQASSGNVAVNPLGGYRSRRIHAGFPYSGSNKG